MALSHDLCTPGEVCCDLMFDLAEQILNIALTPVVECQTSECNAPSIEGYVSMGQAINDPASDYLVVSLQTVETSRIGQNTALQIPVFAITYQVKLLETGWPLPQGDDESIIVPSADMYHEAARQSYAHAEAMFRALANAVLANTIDTGCRDCAGHTIGVLEPTEPSGGSVGWTVDVVIRSDLRCHIGGS